MTWLGDHIGAGTSDLHFHPSSRVPAACWTERKDASCIWITSMPQNLWESSLVWIRPRGPMKCQMILWKTFPRDKEREVWRQRGGGGRGREELCSKTT